MAEIRNRKLYRSRTDKVFAGVCGGLGAFFDLDPLIFRVIFVVLLFVGGSGLPLYLILWVIMPKAPQEGSSTGEADGSERIRNFAQEIKEGAQQFATTVKGTDLSQERRRNSIGLIILLVGLLLLVNQILPVRWFRWDVLWAVLIIVLGITILTKKRSE